MESVGCCQRVVIWQWWRIVGLGMVFDEVFAGLGWVLMGGVWRCRDRFVMGSGWCDFFRWKTLMTFWWPFDDLLMTFWWSFDGKFSGKRNFLSKPIKNPSKTMTESHVFTEYWGLDRNHEILAMGFWWAFDDRCGMGLWWVVDHGRSLMNCLWWVGHQRCIVAPRSKTSTMPDWAMVSTLVYVSWPGLL